MILKCILQNQRRYCINNLENSRNQKSHKYSRKIIPHLKIWTHRYQIRYLTLTETIISWIRALSDIQLLQFCYRLIHETGQSVRNSPLLLHPRSLSSTFQRANTARDCASHFPPHLLSHSVTVTRRLSTSIKVLSIIWALGDERRRMANVQFLHVVVPNEKSL